MRGGTQTWLARTRKNPQQQPRPMQIAIVPGRGSCASSTLRALQQQPESPRAKIRVLVRDEAKLRDAQSKFGGFTCGLGDLGDAAALGIALKGTERVLLTPPTVANREELTKNGVLACKEAGVKFIVFISVFGAQYESIEVAREFTRMEKMILASGIPCTFLRCGSFMQNMLTQAQAIKGEWHSFMGGQGQGKNAMVDTDDIGRVAAKVLMEGPDKHAGKAYDMTGPESLSMAEYAAILSKQVGFTVTYKDMPPEEWGRTLGSWGVPAFLCKILVDLNTVFGQNMANAVSQDVLTITGRHTTFEEWVAKNKEAFGAKKKVAAAAGPWFLPASSALWWA